MDGTPAQRRGLIIAAAGILLLTFAGIDAIWQLWTNRDLASPPDAATTGVWLEARLALAALGAVLILAAAWILWSTRDALEAPA